jgi:hypothetical protein
MSRVLRMMLLSATVLALCIAPLIAQVREEINARLPYEAVLPNPCTGELVALTGFTHVLVQTSTSTSGMIHVAAESNIESAQGFSVDRYGNPIEGGAQYIQTQSISDHSNVDVDTFPSNLNVESSARLTRLGEGGVLIENDDFYTRVQVVVVVNANERVTVQITEVTADCR